ncbi:pyruvate formate-lyase 1-activating enzyme [Fuerstiella marisgermanici]|uniref:Pyruvate formate-lyase 1-activating enzyme n=2 Tax=Fuerstiella marisgermanici TaxID=1891926 RepID=A0A1P8WNA1_9PLAN|nr:AmmeMemoRadiSam system radical SAM enzyme [Fuerstiella marisgermanici]APZ95517.1 pyruvate formate-lyase 1-activating enzyme [Fuerstiella marisgermanici]
MKTVILPPENLPDSAGFVDGGWWHSAEEENRIVCDLCPRECHMKPGDRGFCFVRQNVDGKMKLTTYGRSTGFCIDPIEKKPLNHFYPGTAVLSFGTAGCNLGCRFCQNWDISKSREVEKLSELALPEMIAAAAKDTGCRSVAYTYNDPIIWAEYAIDTAKACRAAGIKSVAVTAGYIMPQARPAFFHAMDAANVDLKAFTEDFYEKITYSKLAPVLETLRWLKHESDVWFEVTNLIIPEANDSPDELRRMCDWLLDAVGADVPIHFTAFHPDFRMTDRGRTPHETLLKARGIALRQGLKFAYVGNVNDVANQSTYCHSCGTLLIERDWHQLGSYQLNGNRCSKCGEVVAGHFDTQPGTWGRRRLPVKIGRYGAAPENLVSLGSGSGVKSPSAEESTKRKMNSMEAISESPSLTDEQEDAIHGAACEIVAATVTGRPIQLPDRSLANAADITVMGVFATLKRNGQLRGCCGSVGQPMNLLQALAQSAARTAKDDHRFPPVSATELPYLTLDVTLLFNFESVTEQGEDRVNAVEVGRHGLKIVRGGKSGLLLPIVAIERGWDSRTFLDQVCRKAGLPITAWQQPDAQLVRFEGRMIEREMEPSVLARSISAKPHPMSQSEVETLAAFARANIMATLQGAVPGCFPANCSDGTVDGIALRLTFRGVDEQAVFSQLQFRGGVPLQTTLLQLTQSAAGWLRNSQFDPDLIARLKVDLVAFADPAMHGVVKSPDVNGIDPASRAVLVTEGQRSAWMFCPELSAEELVERSAKAAQVSMPTSASVFSFAAVSSSSDISNTNVPHPRPGAEVRPAGVAGRFYPSSPSALSAIVQSCLGEVPETKEKWPAVMVPHAGLQFSGRVAGDVLKKIEIPETAIVIGPKHTRSGVDWAVAPHKTWQLPGGAMASDPQLAERLADRIDGLQLDAAAHMHEHCIEVELPLLQELAPQAKVVGIAVGGGNLDRCVRFGQQLAGVISEMKTAPLLIISSDMNHFASDEENRRLDEMALAAMESLDAAMLYDTVTSNSISMCGVLPAVIVMEALRAMGQLSRIQRVSYATSGEVSGDLDRVVGYAGMLLG